MPADQWPMESEGNAFGGREARPIIAGEKTASLGDFRFRQSGDLPRHLAMPHAVGAIDRASDPFDQVDLMAAAGYAETFLDSDPLVRAAEAVLAGKNPPSAHELQDEVFEQRQRCMVELRRIRRDRKAKR